MKSILPALGGDIGGEVRHAPLDDFRTDVDDASPALLFHVRQAGAGEQEGAFNEKIDHRLIKLPVVLLDWLVRLITGRVDDQDVHRTELIGDLLRQAPHVIRFRHVRASENPLAPGVLELGERLFGAPGIIGVIDRHFGAGLAEGHRHRAAQPGAAPRYQGDPAVERKRA